MEIQAVKITEKSDVKTEIAVVLGDVNIHVFLLL